MAKRLSVALIVGFVAAAVPASLSHSPSASAAVLSASAGKLVYKANGVKGWKKWSLPKVANNGGFAIAGKTLTFDGKSDSGAFAPFKTKGMKNFAVEASIKVGAPTSTNNPASYDIFVHRDINTQGTGIYAGYDAVGGEQNATNVADLYWHGSEDEYVPGATLKPDTAFHTYRFEVRGTEYRFLVDGQELVPWTIITGDGSYTQIGLTFTFIPATVKYVKVYKLSGPKVTTTNDTASLVTHSLTTTDVTAAPPFSGVFRDNNLYAADSGFTVAQLQQLGRVYGYLERFSSAATYVSESINLHTNADNAKTIYGDFVQAVKDNANQVRDYHVVDLTGMNIGDESFAYGYDYDYQGAPSYVTEVLFHRGNYYVSIVVDSSDPNVSKTAATLAQTADKFIQAPHS